MLESIKVGERSRGGFISPDSEFMGSDYSRRDFRRVSINDSGAVQRSIPQR